MDRESLVGRLRQHSTSPWDVIVIGGGATGLGIALDSVLRGYSTVLLEQSDLSSGTSSRSTKLVHGGVRYLARGDIFLVTEALHERGLILKNAGHLTANQEFIIPVYTFWDAFLYTAGLKFYDLLAGRLSLGRSYFLGREKTLNRLPLLKQDGLKGGIVYHDGRFDDSRLAISIAGACVKKGALILNYFRVSSLIKDETGRIKGVRATDGETGNQFEISGGLVINATGVFADSIYRMDDPAAIPAIRPSQGVHIVLDKSFLQSDSAIMIPKTDDGRVLFVIPWYGKVVAGTTDTPLEVISMEPKALDEEISFILRTAGKYLKRSPGRDDVLSVFAGLRPLAANPDNRSETREVSRRHKITLSSSGLLSVIGGKWTSYRRMAEETLNRGIRAGYLEKRKCSTRDFNFFPDKIKLESERLRIYGEKAVEIEKLINGKQSLGEVLDPRLPYTKAEIIWILHNEMARNLDDMLARRTRALFLDARAAMAVAPVVASLMAEELGFDLKWQAGQVERFNKLAYDYL